MRYGRRPLLGSYIFKTKAGWGLLELSRLAQTMLLERMNLQALLGLLPPDHRQPMLFN